MTQATIATRPRAGQAAMWRALGWDSRTAWIAIIAGSVGPALLGLAFAGRVSFFALAAVVLIPTPALLALAGLAWRKSWRAQEVVVWMFLDADGQWNRALGVKRPKTKRAAERWLDTRVDSSTPPVFVALALLTAGRTEEARALVATLPVDPPTALHARRDLEMALASADGRTVEAEAGAADAAARADTTQTPQMLAVHLARHASALAQSHGKDGLAELAAARPALGRLTPRWAGSVLFGRFRYAIYSLGVGAWILIALPLAGATAGGAFWL